MYRGDLVLKFVIIFLCLEISRNYDGKLHSKKDARILVLGAGMSGLSTAKTLFDAGYKNILILEAAPHIGGRMKSAQVGNYTVELGAMWIYGRGTNPIYSLAKKHDITLTDSFVDDWTVRDENGFNVTTAANGAYDRIQYAISEINALMQNTMSDFTTSAALRFLNWTSTSHIDDVIEAYTIDFETGVHPSSHSGRHLNLHDTYKDFGNNAMLAVKHEHGFVSMLKYMCEDFIQDPVDQLIWLNKTVTSITYGDNSVAVQTSSGEIIKSDFAVVTFSLGVLQQRLVNFHPPLPLKKRLAIDMFGMSSYSHIYLQFPYAFWDKTMYILYASKFRGKYSFWQNMNTIYPGSNILQLSLFDRDALWVDHSSDEEVVKELLFVLRKMYPHEDILAPIDYAISRWNSDPLFMGAFSYWPSGFTMKDMVELQKPVGRVHFAGEHLDPLHYGFAHAAFMSGQRTAKDIIHCIESTLKCNEPVDTISKFELYPLVMKST
ncbi:hypothetical protein ACF0H5_011078 [Mactra antiquata]